jgi:putrescine transport system ATP-binding protein
MQLKERLGLTFIIVTHDQQEAMTVADRIAVMDRGRLIQVATAAEIYGSPTTLGRRVHRRRQLARREDDRSRAIRRRSPAPPLDGCARQHLPWRAGDAVGVALRPEKIRIARADAPAPTPVASENCVDGRVSSIGYLGDLSVYKVTLDSGLVMQAAVANVTRLIERPIGWGDRVRLSWPPDAAVVLTR